MNAKEKHREKLIEYLASPENKMVSRGALSTNVLGFRQTQQIYKIFSIEELVEIELSALQRRRRAYISDLAKIDYALLDRAKTGDVSAIKLAYQKFEGWPQKGNQPSPHFNAAGQSIRVEFVSPSRNREGDGPQK